MTNLESQLNEAEVKAWKSLSGYKFLMFGYWAAVWVHLNRIGNFKRPNPWRKVVAMADGRSTYPDYKHPDKDGAFKKERDNGRPTGTTNLFR